MIIDDINLSLKVILKNKFRTFITMVGIIVGITFLIIYFSVLGIEKNRFNLNIQKMGKNFFKINVLNSHDYKRYYLNFDDIKSLKNSNLFIESASPEAYSKGYLSNGFDDLSCYIIGGSEDYKDFMMMDILHGRFFTDYESLNKENVILIDNVMSMKLFGIENPIDREVYLSFGKTVEKYKVIGVINYPSNIWKTNKNVSSFCVIPIYSYLHGFRKNPEFDYIYVSVNPDYSNHEICDSITNFLKVKNNISRDIYKGEKFMKPEYKLNDLNDVFLKIVRSISYIFIILSGINITNVMLFTVNNREQEISIRRLSGANRFDIFVQFLVESSILSVIGGVIGILSGVTMVFFINLFMKWDLSINILNLIGFLMLSLIIGFVFGIFPAFKACKVNPIKTLYE